MTRFEFKLKVKFIDEETGEEIYHNVLIDNSNGNEIGFDDMVGLLNHLHEENEQLRQELQKKQEEEKLYAREIVELNKTKNEMLNFKELGGDY